MERYRVYGDDGRSFLAHKGATYQELYAWKKAYNKHNSDKVMTIKKVEERKIPQKRKKTNQFGMNIGNMRNLGFKGFNTGF